MKLRFQTRPKLNQWHLTRSLTVKYDRVDFKQYYHYTPQIYINHLAYTCFCSRLGWQWPRSVQYAAYPKKDIHGINMTALGLPCKYYNYVSIHRKVTGYTQLMYFAKVWFKKHVFINRYYLHHVSVPDCGSRFAMFAAKISFLKYIEHSLHTCVTIKDKSVLVQKFVYVLLSDLFFFWKTIDILLTKLYDDLR